MQKFFSLFIFATMSLSLSAQKFRPYHAFGFEVNANTNFLSQVPYESISFSPNPIFINGTLRFDILGSYDYGIFKWLGVSSGLGLSMRGGAGRSYGVGNGSQDYRMDIFYINTPVRLQLKLFKFLWLEPGVEVNTYLWHSDVGYPITQYYSANQEKFEPVVLNWTGCMRFNLFRGLSLHLGMHRGITTAYWGPSGKYVDFGYRVGVRYIFDQPSS